MIDGISQNFFKHGSRVRSKLSNTRQFDMFGLLNYSLPNVHVG